MSLKGNINLMQIAKAHKKIFYVEFLVTPLLHENFEITYMNT